jgi:hypothetical protein
MNNDKKKTNEETETKADADIARKPYRKPILEELGDLRTITLGGTTTGPDFSGPFTGPFNP